MKQVAKKTKILWAGRKKVRTHVRLTPDTVRRLKQAAALELRTQTAIIERAVRAYTRLYTKEDSIMDG